MKYLNVMTAEQAIDLYVMLKIADNVAAKIAERAGTDLMPRDHFAYEYGELIASRPKIRAILRKLDRAHFNGDRPHTYAAGTDEVYDKLFRPHVLKRKSRSGGPR